MVGELSRVRVHANSRRPQSITTQTLLRDIDETPARIRKSQGCHQGRGREVAGILAPTPDHTEERYEGQNTVPTILDSHPSNLANLTNLYRLSTEVPIPLSQNSTLTASGDSPLLLAQAMRFAQEPRLGHQDDTQRSLCELFLRL